MLLEPNLPEKLGQTETAIELPTEGHRLLGHAFLLIPSGDCTYATKYSLKSFWSSLIDCGSSLKRAHPRLWHPKNVKVDVAPLLDILEWTDYDD